MPTIAAPGGGGDGAALGSVSDKSSIPLSKAFFLLVGSALWVISPAERAAGEGRAAEALSNPPRRVAVSCVSVLAQPEHEGSA